MSSFQQKKITKHTKKQEKQSSESDTGITQMLKISYKKSKIMAENIPNLMQMPKQTEYIPKIKHTQTYLIEILKTQIKRDLEGFRKKDLYRKQQRKKIQISHHKSCMQERMV